MALAIYHPWNELNFLNQFSSFEPQHTSDLNDCFLKYFLKHYSSTISNIEAHLKDCQVAFTIVTLDTFLNDKTCLICCEIALQL